MLVNVPCMHGVVSITTYLFGTMKNLHAYAHFQQDSLHPCQLRLCTRVFAYIFMLSQLTVRGINFVILPTSTQLA